MKQIITIGCLTACLAFVARGAEPNQAFTKDQDTVALWNFDEGEGLILKDQGPLGIDLTFSPGDPDQHPQWMDGKFGKALAFNGGQKVVYAGSVLFGLHKEVTIEAWVNLSEAGTGKWMGIFQNMYYPKSGFRLSVDKRGLLLWQVEAGDYEEGLFGLKPLSRGVWTHVAATYDGTTMKIFVNGELNAQKGCADGKVQSSVGTLTVGYYDTHDGNLYFYGMVDAIRISKVARTTFSVGK